MFDSVFFLCQPYRGKIRKYGLLLYHPETLWSVQLNRLGLEVVRRFDGNHTLQQIEAELCRNAEWQAQKVGDEIFKLAAFLYTNRIISPIPEVRRDIPLFLEEEENPLDLVTLQLVAQCNLRCRHCFIEAGPAQKGILGLADVERIIEKLKLKHPLEIVLTGGEPLLHPNFLAIGCLLKENNLPFSIFTNGVLMDERLAGEIGALRPVSVQVSLDGMTEAVNDGIRGRGTYEKAVRAIKSLVGNGARVVVSTVFCQANWEQYRAFPDFVKELGAASFNPMNVMLSGRAGKQRDEMGLATEQIVEMQRFFQLYQTNQSGLAFGEISLKGHHERLTRDNLELCNAGKNSLFVAYDGTVYPCQTFPESFQTGNLLSNSLDSIWSHRTFRQVRKWNLSDIPGCTGCTVKEFCAGGCLGYNLTSNGGTLGLPEVQSCDWKKTLYQSMGKGG